ncbi:MAG TPA: hypothetical protein VEG32_13370 [Clostridia bacterium]|nr:hypothetical protein [Clostridia bacterium]
MDLLHHQAFLREEDSIFVCSRCGMVNPTDEQPCIPVSSEPAVSGGSTVSFARDDEDAA